MIFYKCTERKLSYQTQHTEGLSLLSSAVKYLYDIEITEADISKGENGKPYFEKHPNICFNISHCDGMIACIIDNKPCGIDCETLRKSRFPTAKRVFSETELRTLEGLDGYDADRFFTSIWTLKEAFAKADGRGLAAMKDVSFCLNDTDIISDRSDYRFMHKVINGFFLSAAVNIDSQFGEILNADDVF